MTSLPQFTIVLGQQQRSTPSQTSCVIQLSAVAVGSGIVALPYAVSLVGYWGAAAMFATIACLTQLSSHWLVTCALLSNKTSYEKNAKFFLGTPGQILVILNLVLLLIMGSAAMIMVSVETILACPLVVGSSPPDPWVVVVGVFVFVSVLTAAAGEESNRLKAVSVVSLGCVVFFVLLLFAQAASRRERLLTDPVSDTTEAVSITVNSYIVSFFIFTLMDQVGRESVSIITQVSSITVFSVITPLYLVIGLLGSYAFDYVPPNILAANWTIDPPWLVETGRLSIALVNLVKLPLLFIPLRQTVSKWFPATFPIHFQTLVLQIIIFLVAVSFSSVATLFGLIGTTCGVCISFTIPALMSFQKQFIEDEQADLARRVMTFYHSQPDSEPVTPSAARNARNRRGKRVLSAAVVLGSVVFMTIGFLATFANTSTEFIDVYRG